MPDYVICECTPLEDTLIRCAPVLLPDSNSAEIYIGPSGAFVVAESEKPEALWGFLLEFFRTGRIGLYLVGSGLYDPSCGCIGSSLDDDDLSDAIYMQATLGVPFWDDEELAMLQKRICFLDARSRGIYRDSDGNWFIARKGKFHPLSRHDPDRTLRMALLGGILGLHRFVLGKWYTGVLYLLTGGLMGFGWLLDTLQLITGTMRDKAKHLIAKPTHTGLLWYVAGIFSGTVLFGFYTLFSGFLADSLNRIMQALPAAF